MIDLLPLHPSLLATVAVKYQTFSQTISFAPDFIVVNYGTVLEIAGQSGTNFKGEEKSTPDTVHIRNTHI